MSRPAAIVLALAVALTACSGEPVADGAALAKDIGCLTCHVEQSNDLGPTLYGLWGSQVALTDGSFVTADAEYIRRSIVNPPADVVAGYQASMPYFPLNQEEVDLLVEWVRTLE